MYGLYAYSPMCSDCLGICWEAGVYSGDLAKFYGIVTVLKT